MRVVNLYPKEKDRKNKTEKEHIENFNYEISTDLSSSGGTNKKQNSLKTTYDIHEDMIFPS